jgi:hypothetical protein
MACEEVRGMYAIGAMPMPAGFRYREVFLKGKPQHDRDDPFRIRHPKMPCDKRAKIFSPFDALKGFSEAVASKDILYINRPELGDEDKAEINRKLGILYELTRNGKLARENKVTVKVTYFVPCTDKNNTAYGSRGQRVSVTGICKRVDGTVSCSITVSGTVIRFADILSIEAKGIFDEDWGYDEP